MLSISIQVDGTSITTIDLTGMQVVSVSVHGALDSNPKAILSANGGNYDEGGCGHLIWISEHALLLGEVLSVGLNEISGTADQGKTIEELYPDEEPYTKSNFQISEEMATEIRARPRLHEAFAVHVKTSVGQRAEAVSDDLNTDFSFRFLWNNLDPHQARVRLATYCLYDVLARTDGTEHLQTKLSLGDTALFSILK